MSADRLFHAAWNGQSQDYTLFCRHCETYEAGVVQNRIQDFAKRHEAWWHNGSMNLNGIMRQLVKGESEYRPSAIGRV